MSELFVPAKLSSGRVHPHLLYGTAFKDERTKGLTALALKSGFEGLDTANYPTAYDEAAAGDALQEAFKCGLKREDIIIQTKFTPAWAHAEGKLPYKADQPVDAQVRESIEQSFRNLKVEYIDILMLHVPFEDDEDNVAAWEVFETFVPARIGVLGVSNFSLPAFKKLFEAAKVKPEIVQNRFQEQNSYDIELRGFFREKGVLYQAFNLLKASKEVLASELIARFCEQLEVPKEVAFYLLVLGLGGISILNGTTSEEHMQLDLQKVKELLSSPTVVDKIKSYLEEFEGLLQNIANQNCSV